MEKKFYLKPDTEVLDIIFENSLLAGTNNYGDSADEYEFDLDDKPGGGNASDYD